MVNFTLFYFKFLDGERNPDENFWKTHVSSPIVFNWRGLAFERVCLQHIAQIKRKLGIAGVSTKVYAWSGATVGGKGVQIDLLIDRADNVINLCEMKYSYGKYDLTPAECDKLLRRRDVFISVTGTEKSVHLTMVTPKGVAESPERHILQSEVTLDDFFR